VRRLGCLRQVGLLTIRALVKGTERLSLWAEELLQPVGIDRGPTTSGIPTGRDEIAHYTLKCPQCDYAVRVDVQPFMSLESITLEHGDTLHRAWLANTPLEQQG
jgi:hypothetical protein